MAVVEVDLTAVWKVFDMVASKAEKMDWTALMMVASSVGELVASKGDVWVVSTVSSTDSPEAVQWV